MYLYLLKHIKKASSISIDILILHKSILTAPWSCIWIQNDLFIFDRNKSLSCLFFFEIMIRLLQGDICGMTIALWKGAVYHLQLIIIAVIPNIYSFIIVIDHFYGNVLQSVFIIIYLLLYNQILHSGKNFWCS